MTSKYSIDSKSNDVRELENEQKNTYGESKKASHSSNKHFDEKVNKDFDEMDDLIKLEQY
jgi:hypothetical protein